MKTILYLLTIVSAIAVSGCTQDHVALMYMGDPVPSSTGPYRLGCGDQLRVMVFDQPALSNIYGIDASGNVSIPLVGTVKADNKTARELEASIIRHLEQKGLVTDPKVAVEVAVYRPFSILGEVRTPGRFPYAPGMTIEAAVAMAGGYTLHADQAVMRITRRAGDDIHVEYVPPVATFMAGDTIYIAERWF